MIVFDVTKESSFENVKIWKKEFENCVNLQVNGKSIPFLLVGNKIDMIGSRKIEKETAEDWCRNNSQIIYFETTAKDGTAVQELCQSDETKEFKTRNYL